jgi:poly(hydroxyalkanoate) depolymerase family esterase
MPRLSETIARLKGLREGAHDPAGHRLSELEDFGPNPGALRAHLYLPASLAPGAALVVVLHGCTQSAGSYDYGSGWSQLADRHGFALLFPEQVGHNNAAGCFNWFAPGDTRRGAGEVMSIHQMIDATIGRHALDAHRVFITGLSAGGAMALAMMATYPEIFAGGAVIGGLPYGCASSVTEALERMRGHGMPSTSELEASVRSASRHDGTWPSLSVWHGSADHTVVPANADAIAGQWLALHGLQSSPAVVQKLGPHTRHTWQTSDGRDAVERWLVSGMGHGTAIDAGAGGVGSAGPFFLDVGLSSTQRIAHRWGLASAATDAVSRNEAQTSSGSPVVARFDPARASEPGVRTEAAMADVRKVIEDALRIAGLMR